MVNNDHYLFSFLPGDWASPELVWKWWQRETFLPFLKTTPWQFSL
jgi:hypothetical protein